MFPPWNGQSAAVKDLQAVSTRIMALASQDHGAILERRESLKLLVSAATRRMFAMVQEVDRQRAIIRSRADHSSRRRT